MKTTTSAKQVAKPDAPLRCPGSNWRGTPACQRSQVGARLSRSQRYRTYETNDNRCGGCHLQGLGHRGIRISRNKTGLPCRHRRICNERPTRLQSVSKIHPTSTYMQTVLQRSGCGALTTRTSCQGRLLAFNRVHAAPVRVRRGVTVHAHAPVEPPQIVPSLPESPQQQSAAPSWSFPEKVSNFLRSTAKAAAVLGVAVALVSGCGDRLVTSGSNDYLP